MTMADEAGNKGLGRFVRREQPDPGAMDVLKRFLDPAARARPRPGEQCEMCGVPIAEPHAHVVNLESRSLLCTCRPCYLLFAPDGAAQGKYRAVPERYLHDPAFTLTEAQWEDFQIPVGIAYFFFNSSMERYVAFYPSPGGATESLLELDALTGVLEANPAFADVLPDVEAILVRKAGDGFEGYVAPIDACYELVGRVRVSWKGFGGGEEVWEEIDRFFGELRERSQLVGAGRADA